MARVTIIKTGSTYPELARRRGDFEDWIGAALLKAGVETETIDATRSAPLPAPASLDGAIVTGSHAMVTDEAAWSERTGAWLRQMTTAETPLLAICFGHQLLARAWGGVVDYHVAGPEMGRVTAQLGGRTRGDLLFGHLPERIDTLNGHNQFVLQPPPGAVILAATDRDRCHALRLGKAAWGVQFHPEIDADITRFYIGMSRAVLEESGQDPDGLSAACCDTPLAAGLLQRFAEIVGDWTAG